MAYKNLLNVPCSSGAEVWRHLVDWLTSRNGIADYTSLGLGWTLHDSFFAVDQDNPTVDDWVVLSSAGEDGKQGLYWRLLYSTVENGIVRHKSGLYWDASTNAWVSGFPANDVTVGMISGTAFSLWVFGSLDSLSVVVGNGTGLYGAFLGLPARQMYSTDIATTTADVTSGSNVSVAVDVVPEGFAVGVAVVIRSNAAIQLAVISAISGTTITFSSLSSNYPSGSRIAADYSLLISGAGKFLSTMYTQIGRNGTVIPGNSLVIGANPLSYTNPDSRNSDPLSFFIGIYGSLAAVKGYYGQIQNVVEVSPTGITSGLVYNDRNTGDAWRALYIDSDAKMYLFKEV